MSLESWALPRLQPLLPLDEAALREVIDYAATLPDEQAAEHFRSLLGESSEANDFIDLFNMRKTKLATEGASHAVNGGNTAQFPNDSKTAPFPDDVKSANGPPVYAPPPGPPPSAGASSSAGLPSSSRPAAAAPFPSAADEKRGLDAPPPAFAPPSYPPPSTHRAVSNNGYITSPRPRPHTNAVIRAGEVRARDEQKMQNWLQNLQYQYHIYNSEIEPEHDAEYYCSCPIHQYQRAKWQRQTVQDMWSKAVMYPGEKAYTENLSNSGQMTSYFTSNPYANRIASPYGTYAQWGPARPQPGYHAQSIHQEIALNNKLNAQAQRDIDAQEPRGDIWANDDFETALAKLNLGGNNTGSDSKYPTDSKRGSISGPTSSEGGGSKLSKFKKSIGIKSTEEKAIIRFKKDFESFRDLREAILAEENGRWQDEITRQVVATYQAKVGMTGKIAHLRQHQPIQYLHLLRAGYFEPIPVAWAGADSNPLKFKIEAPAGWRGITPAWRGYEDTAEERLYWVLNHREGAGATTRMKPDFISEMNMARERMERAVEPPPEYYSPNDTCHLQHTSKGYSRQVMPSPFRAFDRPEVATDDTMILLDTSGSMDFDPVRPIYNQYLITNYARTTQPKNKDVAKAVIRRFTDAMANHDHQFKGYDLTTFASQASYIGCVNHKNLDALWSQVHIGGGTRVMTGWQKVKDLHFQKHSASAVHHPVFGWQAGPETPMLRLLLLLDGEATDMDEFELDLLGLSWAHVTIFLIGADGCPHHHRHANELQRISDVNHHVSFVDAQGNCPERFVTHELLKRHLGYEISMAEFTAMEELPPYVE